MRFRCPHCSQKLTAKEHLAGKVRACPHCQGKLRIPTPAPLKAQRPERDAAAINSPANPLDNGLLELAPAPKPTERDREETLRRQEEALLNIQDSELPCEPPSQRPLAWPRDILLYPANVSGIIHLVIFSFLAGQLRPALQARYWEHPPIMHLALLVIGGGYCLFYLTGCIRDSAGGGLRAPDVNQLPEQLSTDAILAQLFATFAWATFCVGPLLVCIIVGRTDYLLWLLVAYAVIYAPMALLAVVLFDSVRALNPLLILPSILSVLFPYLVLVLSCGLISALFVLLYWRVALGGVFCAYLLMVVAHILGRFYLRYEDRLNWEA